MGTERKIIAITGGIGTGKSVVSALLRVMGYEVYDCDAGAKWVMTHDERLRREIVELFGEEAYIPDGTQTLNKTYLSARIFTDPALLQRMNAAVHPAVARDLMQHYHRMGGSPFFFESAILFESGFDGLVTPDEVWTVSAPLELRIERAMQRDGVTREKVLARINAQMPQEEKERRADHVIVNDEQTSLIAQVKGRIKALIVFILTCLLILPTTLRATTVERQRLDSLERIAYTYLEKEQWDSAIYHGEKFFEAAYEAEDYHNSIISAHICLGIALSRTGNYPTALGHLGQAHCNAETAGRHDDSKTTFEQLYDIAQAEYETNLRKQKNLELMALLLTGLAIIALLLYIMYREKSRLLEAIVRQNHEALKRPSPTADARMRELTDRLTRLMEQEHTYRENLLTKERVAELLETNRTYLSQAINEVFGKSFTQYINDLRIDEAIRLLDDATSTRALRLIGQDLGFNSPTTFSTQFQARTGMTPAQYRQKVQKIVAK